MNDSGPRERSRRIRSSKTARISFACARSTRPSGMPSRQGIPPAAGAAIAPEREFGALVGMSPCNHRGVRARDGPKARCCLHLGGAGSRSARTIMLVHPKGGGEPPDGTASQERAQHLLGCEMSGNLATTPPQAALRAAVQMRGAPFRGHRNQGSFPREVK